MIPVFPANMRDVQQNRLDNITLRGFGGGWNALDSDVSMEQRFLVKARNFRRTASGSMKLRWGSKWFADLTGLVIDNILDMEYFSDALIVVTKDGRITAIGNTGNKVQIWNATIAAALPGSPTGWGGNLTSVDFVPYKNQLIVHNGVDKPVTISKTLVVTYLQDLASGSNLHVPIGRYGCVVSNYHCISGVPSEPTVVYVSSVGTAGTFIGDPAPNDSIKIDIGAFAPQGAVEVRGIAGFRANLVVFFQDQAVIVKLGVYDDVGVHKPTFPDAMPNFGSLGHRTMATVENDLLFAGLQGLSNAKRNVLNIAGTLESATLSEYIEPEYKSDVGVLTNSQQLFESFAVWDGLSRDLILVLPNRTYVYSYDTRLRYRAWTEFSELSFTCGCKSFLGRVYFAQGVKVFQYGNGTFAGEDYFTDRKDDRSTRTWTANSSFAAGELIFDSTNNTSYQAQFDFISGTFSTFAEERAFFTNRWAPFEGLPVSFELELPWLDSKDPMKVKQLRFISIGTRGTAPFTVDAFVDNLYKDIDGNVIWPPSLSMEFIGMDAPGEGYDAGPYGGGRRSNDPRLFSFPLKFKRVKIRISGTKQGNLEVVNMSFLFNRGRYRR